MKIVQRINLPFLKTFQGSIEESLSIAEIKYMMKLLRIQVSFEFARGYQKV